MGGEEVSGGNCIKVCLPGKSILRDYFQENRISRQPFLLLRISFPGRPIFIQFIPGGHGGRGVGSVVIWKTGRVPELIESLKLGNVWVFAQLIFTLRLSTNQLCKNPNIA